MQTVSRMRFTTVKTEGAILPADLLQRVADGRDLDGLTPADYHLAPNERLNEAINRAWNRCLGVWHSFDEQRAGLPASDAGTTLTRERWLLILFQELGYGRLPYQGSLSLGPNGDAPRYPISHAWGHAPIHLVSFRQHLDRRADASSGQTRSPHSLVQEYLNRAEGSLWGLLSNGLRLRVLRDNSSLTRAAYVEFDLEAMMSGELYADFALLWLVCHQSRVESERPAECWLERWSQAAAEQGTRALDALRDGVQDAISALGRGFLSHPANRDLKAALRSGDLTAQDYYRQLLRLVYRLIFLFVAEDRDLLLLPDAPADARRRYVDYYSVRRLRDLAEAQRGGPHPDLYRNLRLVFGLLQKGYPALALPGLGGYLFSAQATLALDDADLSNRDLLDAIRALAFTVEGKVRRPVDYKNLGAEELGSVYESLLELHPQLNADAGAFALDMAAGSERKTTGSYYTPSSLIRCLLDSALEPVVEERLARAGGERAAREVALLDIKVVDPAAGSGHFLIAAAHRLARHLARVRTGDEEPAPGELRAALRDVMRHCIHGVDINPMAVELCKVALWMESLDPGKPLSFLDRNIQCGNSLIGVTPALLEKGIPDEAFTPIEGDDRAYCTEWRKRNKQQRESRQLSLFAPDLQPWNRLGDFAASMMRLDTVGEDTVGDVQRKQQMYESLVHSSDYRYGRLWADAWCAAFVWKKTKEFAYPITEEVFRRIEHNPFDVAPWMVEEIEQLREQYQFFHWHLAFPHVFSAPKVREDAENKQTGWNSGFDVVLGNPPWERIKLQEKEWFTAYRPDIANARNTAARRKQIGALALEDAVLHSAFLAARREVEGTSHFVRNSDCYPLCGRGDVNTYAVFSELSYRIQDPQGHAGIIVPSGIATDDTTKYFFQALIDRGTLLSLYDFENRNGIFPAVHRSYKFCLLTVSGHSSPATASANFVFFALQVADLQDEERRFSLSASEIDILNPNSRTCPVFRNKRDAELAKTIYGSTPVLIRETPQPQNLWHITFLRMFDMANDSALFRTRHHLDTDGFEFDGRFWDRDEASYVPLLQPKHFNQFNHRFASVLESDRENSVPGKDLSDPHFATISHYWVPERSVEEILHARGWSRNWLVLLRAVARNTDVRTSIACVSPKFGVGHNSHVLLSAITKDSPTYACALLGNLNCFLFDYVVRVKVSAPYISQFQMRQFPVLEPDQFRRSCLWDRFHVLDWVHCRVLELTYTAWDLQPFAHDCGYDGPPFRWDEERRFLLRCELDAAYFHLYGIARDDVDYIMDTFPIVKRKDEAAHGEYRTKRVILEMYDEMGQAMETGREYQTRLDPPPADARVAHAPG